MDAEEKSGKINDEFFDAHLRSRFGSPHESVIVEPKYGVDFGAIEVEDATIVVSTDPLVVYPTMGFEKAGQLALHSVLSDVAVSGVSPSFLAVNLILPESITADEFDALWRGIHHECERLDVTVITGHTAKQTGISYPWVGGAMAMGIKTDGKIIRPDGARSEDRILLTKGPGIEVVGLFSTLFPEAFDLNEDLLERAQSRFNQTTLVEDALTAAEAGKVTAMHDVTECGLVGGLAEMAESADVRLDVSREAVEVPADVAGVCAAVDLDPWEISSRGTLLITVPPDDADSVKAALENRGTPVYDIGSVSEGRGVYIDGKQAEHPGTDPAWDVFEQLQEKAPNLNPSKKGTQGDQNA